MPRSRIDVLTPDSAEQTSVVSLAHALVGQPAANSSTVFLIVGEERIPVSDTMIHAIRDAAQHLQRGASIQIVPMDRELSLSEAGIMLGVSREFVRRLVESGEIDARYVGTHRRITAEAVMAYRDRRTMRRRKAIHELHEQSALLGGYDAPENA
jgi:excisionase family DNA binding protein